MNAVFYITGNLGCVWNYWKTIFRHTTRYGPN